MTEKYEPIPRKPIPDSSFFYDEVFERAFIGKSVSTSSGDSYVPKSSEYGGIMGSLSKPTYIVPGLLDTITEDTSEPSETGHFKEPQTSTLEKSSTETDPEESEQETERKKKEKLLRERYPKACALVKNEVAREGKYDSEYYFDKMIEEIGVAELTETTLRYLEDWDTFEFGLNSPNLKPAILREVILRDYYFTIIMKKDKSFISLLEEMNMSAEEYVADLQLYVERTMSESQLFRATDHEVLINHILAEDERWKSQFETGNSGGMLKPWYRSDKEGRFFGFPDHFSAEAKTTDESSPYHVSKRPIYGFFTTDENGILNDSGTQPPPNATKRYGKAHCKVKRSKHSETTIAFGDSIDSRLTLSPFIKPHYTSLNLNWFSPSRAYGNMFDVDKSKGKRPIKHINPTSLRSIMLDSYTEAQFSNGLRMEDIESIHVSEGNDLSRRDIEKIRLAVDKYNSRHPDSEIKLIEY